MPGNRAPNSSVPHMTYYDGHPPTTSERSPPPDHHHHKQPPLAPVKTLTFLYVGNLESAIMPLHHLTCTSIEFAGHIKSTNALFGILAQLPLVEDVTIVIGPQQQHYLPEAYRTVPACPSVRNLKIEMDHDNFHSFRHYDCSSGCTSRCDDDNYMSTMQYSLIHLVETLLIHAKCSFPYLKNIEMDLIENDRLHKAVESLMESCPAIWFKMQARASLEEVQMNADGRNQQFTSSFNGAGINWSGNRFQAYMEDPYLVLNHQDQVHDRHYGCPYQAQTNDSSTNSQAQHPRSDGEGSDVPPISRPHHNRPPPGFSPLPNATRQRCSGLTGINTREACSRPGQFINSQNEHSVYQRVNKWLRNVQDSIVKKTSPS